MQAQTLPISINTANATPAPARAPGADGAADASPPFAEALSREIGQRRQAAEATKTAPAEDTAIAPRATPAAQPRDAAVDAAQAAIAADAAAVDPVTDMLALAASIAPPAAAPIAIPASPSAAPHQPAAPLTDKMGTDPISAAAMQTVTSGKMGSDPILASGKMGSDPILASGKMGTDPILASGKMGTDPILASGKMGSDPILAQGKMGSVPISGVQLRSMFATASAQVAQAPGAGVASDAAPLASDPLLGVVAQPQARAALQAGQAAPAQGGGPQQELTALASADSAPETAAVEAPPQEVSFATQLQAARAETAPANQLVAGDRLPARVGTPAWDKQLGQKIVFMAAGAEQSASLILNPPDLGPVQVVLNITNDQASVAFSSSQLEVRQALENAMPKLREMMGESGITLGNATVNAGMPEQQQQAQRGQDARAGRQHGNGRGNSGGAGGDDAAAPAQVRRVALGAVDTFA